MGWCEEEGAELAGMIQWDSRVMQVREKDEGLPLVWGIEQV